MTISATWRQDYRRQGFAVLRGLLSSNKIVAARIAYAAISKSAPTDLPIIDSPLLVMWQHVRGGFKRYLPLYDATEFFDLVADAEIIDAMTALCGGPVRLLETIVFNKPPGDGGALAWHQDVSFYPLSGGTQVSALIVLDPATKANGAVSFAVGSHKGDVMSAVDLHSGAPRANDLRATPKDPSAAGFEVVTPDLKPGDVVLFHSHIWHGSGPNTTLDQPRRLVSIRYVSLDTCYLPVPGNAASFMHQIRSSAGEPLSGGAFPILK
jgi:ectoine hydroxylase-related dioxygenase (phytanoyl-CoA dioxygenase family)